MKNLIVEGYITEKADTRQVKSKYCETIYKICDALLSETKKATKENSITLTLWDEDIEKFRIGDHVQINNGYATSFMQKVQLNIGKYGNIKLLV